MFRRPVAVAVVFCLASLVSGVPAGGGEAVRRPPERIVSLAPSVTETLFALGLGERVVGATDYCLYPPEAAKVPKVGGYTTPNYEAMAALRPDLVVLLPEHGDVERHLAALGLSILKVDHRTVEAYLGSLRVLGERCGAPERAAALEAELRGVLERIVRARAGRPRPRTVLTLGRSMGYGGGLREIHAAGPACFHSNLVHLAGGENVVPEGPAPYPVLSAEGLLRLDPEVVVEFAPGAKDASSVRREWNDLRNLRAVKEGKVLVFAQDFLVVPGPRLLRFIEDLARAMDPGAFEKAPAR